MNETKKDRQQDSGYQPKTWAKEELGRIEEQEKIDAAQTRRGKLNTVLIATVLLLLITISGYGYAMFKDLSAEQQKTSEIAQLVKDEGYRKCVYADSRKFPTIGFGHLVLPTESFTCITPKQAVELLRQDYNKAEASVDANYYWAYGEVRLVLINMTYQMGSTGVDKFKNTLMHLQDEDYDAAASELLDSRWASQTPTRSARLAGRIMSLN